MPLLEHQGYLLVKIECYDVQQHLDVTLGLHEISHETTDRTKTAIVSGVIRAGKIM